MSVDVALTMNYVLYQLIKMIVPTIKMLAIMLNVKL